MAEEGLPEDHFYHPDELSVGSNGGLPSALCSVHASFGFPSTKIDNLFYLDEGATIMFAAGSRVHFHDVNTDEQTYLRTLSGQAVGAVAVHPSKQYICVAETGTNPLCCVYAYPSRKLYRVLRGGTERAFSAASFDLAGGKLATVGSFPDYMLTVWDWKSESIVLRSKAFSQEVFRVTFSPYVDGSLITSGTGHIRFWRMASTFTGLKLQGDIGKFGTVELTDIRGYVELPSGKVLSGSDWGNFLLWNGNLIECEVCREGGAKCHDGAVNFLNIEEDRIISAGDDGRLIQWDLKAVEAAEVTEENPLFQLTPMAEMSLAGKEPGREHARLQTLTKAPDGQWLVQDEAGALYKVDLSTQIVMTVKRFHSGAITGVDTSPKAHLAATCGADGSVRVWNYLKRELVAIQRFGVGATCLTWASLAVDLDARTLAVGFSDGTLRVLQVCSDGLELVAALKPHAARVKHVLYSPNGKQIVTSADDGTVFFVDVAASYAPLGYMQLPSAVVSASWKSDSTALLVGYGHELVALDTPQPGAFDSSQSFLLALAATPLGLDDVRTAILSRLHAEREALREVAKAKYLEKHPQPTDDPELAAEMEAARLEVEAEEESARGPVVAPPVVARSLLPQEDGSLLVAVDSGNESLGVWSLREPGEVPEQLREGTPLTCWLGTSCSKRYVTSAGVDGSVTLAPQMAAPYWEGHLHEALRLDEAGAITARLSFDDGYLVSASTDGTFFVLGVAEVEPDKSAPGIDLMPSRTGDLVADVSATAYSLEEAKQKVESDARAAAADRAKMTVRERIADLRKRFDGLRAKNEAASDADRLPKDQFSVDPGLRERIQRETEDRLTGARRELAWDSEAGAVALHKLESKYVEPLEVEDIVLYGFANRKSARSIRTSKLTPWQCEAIDAVHELINAELTSRGAGDGAARAAAGLDGASEGDNGAEQGTTATEGGDAGEASQDGALDDVKISKAEQRAMRRAARAKAWASFMARKPAEGFSDPADIAAIEVAKATLGFFSLKTDPDYVVPEALRVNAQKKRRQLVLLDESVHALKMAYNERFLALRNLKRRMIDAMSAEHERLSAIEAELGIEPRSAPPPTTLAPEEEPEQRSRVTEADLAAHAVVSAKGASGSFGGFGGGSSASPGAKLTTSSSHFEAPAAGDPSRQAQSAVRDSPLVAAERALARAKLEFERRGLLERRSRSIASFDSALEELRIERFRLLADLKSAELRRILLFRELHLLKEFEKRDNALASKLAKAHTDKAEVAARVADCQEKLNAKKVEMEKMLEADRAIMEEFTTTVGERHKAFDALLKIFRRKIKRTRKPVQNDDAEDPDRFDSEDESDDDDDDDDDDEEEEEEEEVCPPGCEESVYSRVCELREARLDQEEVYNEFQKGVEAIKRENDILSKKEKGFDKVLLDTEQNIQAFQAEKQSKLNELYVMVTLACSQIDTENGRVPADTSAFTVFPMDKLEALQARPGQIREEKQELRRRQKALRVEHQTMIREQTAREARAREHEARLNDVQMLKFGQMVDIEALDAVGVNRSAEEVRRRISATEAKQAEELKALRKTLAAAKADLKVATEQSTQRLNAVASLFERQQKLEADLNKGQASAATDTAGERRERQRLVALVKVQAREVESLKLEINMLRRKGGHVYSAPAPHSHPTPSV